MTLDSFSLIKKRYMGHERDVVSLCYIYNHAFSANGFPQWCVTAFSIPKTEVKKCEPVLEKQ